MAHAVTRAVAPQRKNHALAGRLQRIHVGPDGIEHIGVRLGPLGCEIAALPRAGVDHRRCTFRRRKRRQTDELDGVEPLAPFGLAEVEAVRRRGLVTRAGTSFGPTGEGLPAGAPYNPALWG